MAHRTLTPGDLSTVLNTSPLPHIYCFCGNDEHQKEEAVLLIAKKLWKSQSPEHYTITTYFAEDGIEQALGAISSVSLFEGTTLHIIKHCEQISTQKKIQMMVLDCVNHMPASSFVIFDTQEYRPPSLLPSQLHTQIPVIHFYKPFEENCKSYILKKCKTLSLTISQDATELLVDLTGSNIKEIDNILASVSLSGTTDITRELLEGFVINERDAIEFEFVDSFYLKDTRVWNLLSEAIERNISQILLLSLLFTHAIKLEEYHLKTAKGIAFDTLMKELKIYGRRQKMFAKQATVYSLENIRRLIAVLYTYDIKLKTNYSGSYVQDNPLFDLLLQNLI